MRDELTWYDAILDVLEEQDEPMSCTEITQEVIDRELKTTLGATPNQTVSATISRAIQNDPDCPFQRVGHGLYRLHGAPSSDEESLDEDDVENDFGGGAVQAFGILWRRDWVDWSSNRLEGNQAEASDRIDFAEQSGIYILYDRDRPVYVGRSTEDSLLRRLKSHTTGRFASRWNRFSWFGFRPVENTGVLGPSWEEYEDVLVIEALEAVLIEALEPPQNRKQGDRFNGVEYNQTQDRNIKAKELRRQLDELTSL